MPSEGEHSATEPESRRPSPATGERHCEHVRTDGSRCKGWKVKGQSLCAGHLGKGVASDPATYGKRGASVSADIRHDRAEKAKKRPVDVYRDAMNEHAELFVRERIAIVKDRSQPAADRLRAMEQLENRALGRPTERVETVSNPVDEALEQWSQEEIDAYLRGLDDLPPA